MLLPMTGNKKSCCTSMLLCKRGADFVRKIAALRKTRVDYSCMAGRTPRERKERERLFKLIATNDNPEARKNALEDPDRWFPGPESPPPSDGELGLALAKELEMANLPVVRLTTFQFTNFLEMGSIHEEAPKCLREKIARFSQYVHFP